MPACGPTFKMNVGSAGFITEYDSDGFVGFQTDYHLGHRRAVILTILRVVCEQVCMNGRASFDERVCNSIRCA